MKFNFLLSGGAVDSPNAAVHSQHQQAMVIFFFFFFLSHCHVFLFLTFLIDYLYAIFNLLSLFHLIPLCFHE